MAVEQQMTTSPKRRRPALTMKATPAMLAAASEEEQSWRRQPTRAQAHEWLWAAMARAAMEASDAG